MDAIRECCAGLDVHQKNVVACILKGPLREAADVFAGVSDCSVRTSRTLRLASGVWMHRGCYGEHRSLLETCV